MQSAYQPLESPGAPSLLNPFSPASSFRPRVSTFKEADMSIFRSEPMSLAQIYIPAEIAQATIAELGEAGLIQFRDLDPSTTAFARPFVDEVRRLDEMERKMRFLETQLEKAGISVREHYGDEENDGYAALNNAIGVGNQQFDTSAPYPATRSHQLIEELELCVNEHDDKVRQMNAYQESLNKRNLELIEMKYVLREVNEFFNNVRLACCC
jgi:V-type H+-transporting ATPase subunit a